MISQMKLIQATSLYKLTYKKLSHMQFGIKNYQKKYCFNNTI